MMMMMRDQWWRRARYVDFRVAVLLYTDLYGLLERAGVVECNTLRKVRKGSRAVHQIREDGRVCTVFGDEDKMQRRPKEGEGGGGCGRGTTDETGYSEFRLGGRWKTGGGVVGRNKGLKVGYHPGSR